MDTTLTLREQKAIEIADRCRIVESSGKWIVPSQNSSKKYAVRIVGNAGDCECPDFELRREPCKHLLAVQYLIQREQNPDGSTTVTETVAVTKRTTYPQAWPAYNLAQTTEKDRFQELLRDLCACIPEPPRTGARGGRPRAPLSDAMFSATFKVYSTFSGRRFMSDLREAHKRGFIEHVPHYNSIFNYLEDKDLTPVLTELIEMAAAPLKAVEEDFAADSSGFTTSRFYRWYDHKYGQERTQHDWVKVHIMCGVKTNVVTAVEIKERAASDTKQLPALVEATAKNFTMREVSGDKAYGSIQNTNAVAKAGATPFIAFKSGHTGKGGGLWSEMFHYFMFRRSEFLEHYHKRSNVEATFSMIKRKFGDSVRSKTDVAMKNEALCKILCHNIVVLIHEIHELGIEPVFTSNNH